VRVPVGTAGHRPERVGGLVEQQDGTRLVELRDLELNLGAGVVDPGPLQRAGFVEARPDLGGEQDHRAHHWPVFGAVHVDREVGQPFELVDRQWVVVAPARLLLDVQLRERVDLDQPRVDGVLEHATGGDGGGGCRVPKVTAVGRSMSPSGTPENSLTNGFSRSRFVRLVPSVLRLPRVGPEWERLIDEIWIDWGFEAERFFDAGDQVAVFVRTSGTAKQSGAPVEIAVVHVLTLNDGRVTRTQVFLNRQEALEAAGLRE
jgi:hypothetical protein